jgi:acyl-CoA synthetase (AMP-forming)/AMP-acid ligase II
VITGGAPVAEPLIRAYLERGLTLLQGYGLSEAAPVASVSASGQEQVAIALVVVAPGAETSERELLAWCREHLAAHQVPAVVTFVDRLPRNSVGKLNRAELQQAAALGCR